MCSCLVLAASAVGVPVTTVEGSPNRASRPTCSSAFVDAGAIQCGFCTPGLVMAAHVLLDRNAAPTLTEIREELAGNVCRCTGYGRLVAAVQQVALDRSRVRR